MKQQAKITKDPQSMQQYVENYAKMNAREVAYQHTKRTGLQTDIRALGSRIQYLLTDVNGHKVTIYCIPNK